MSMMKIDCVTVGDIQTNCWLYAPESLPENSGTRCVVIDPGDEAGAIISRLRELRWVPLYIFLPHGHFDHLMALPDLLEAFGKDAKAGIHRLDAHYLGKDAMRHHRNSFAAIFQCAAKKVANVDRSYC
jgi:glyoxylase-like metal-dependent hydrolase (beta-lactamase superfamily II)